MANEAVGIDPSPSYSLLHVNVAKCTGCRVCEMACSLKNYGECNPARARIYIVKTQEEGYIVNIPVVCQQCADPLCMTMCPANALSRNTETNAVVVDDTKCLGCRTCVEVCPFGAPSVDPRLGISQKCDLCDGDPICVKGCSQGALAYVPSEEEGLYSKRSGVDAYMRQLRLLSSR